MADVDTYLPDTDYFFLGDGRIMVAIQWSRNADASPYGILLCDPERMSRKNGSLLFHPEMGLARTMLTLIVDGERHTPQHADVQVAWDFSRNHSVVVRWRAGAVEVTERFSVQQRSSILLRDVTLSAPEGASIQVEAALYANPLFFDEFGDRTGSVLYATGYTSITCYSVPTGRAFERFLTASVSPRNHARVAATFLYAIEAVGTHEFSGYPSEHRFAPLDEHPAPLVELGPSFQAALEQADETVHAPSLAARVNEAYRVARTSLRATVSQLGKFDASIWQYDYEWGMDAAMVAAAAASSGLLDLARQTLTNILRRLSNSQGMIAEASRFRGGEMSELNGNGAVLDALWHYWHWSGDTTLLDAHWDRIAAIADYPLRPEFQHPSGLLKTRRDFWERTPWMGVMEGFELGHQTYCAVGLRRAAEIADALDRPDEAARWRAASERIHHAMLQHPEFSLVADGHFIHRRLVDGTVQERMAPDPDYNDHRYAPYLPPRAGAASGARSSGAAACEPDITEALPIVYGLVDPASDLARATMDYLGALWSPNGNGGYARYNIESDPDSPGPWAFATAFMAAAEIELGDEPRYQRTIAWLLDAAGRGGSWFEYYGERQTPPYPPIGIIVWGWAQYLLLVVKHIVGVRVSGRMIRIAPKMIGIEHTVRFGGHRINISVRGLAGAELDGDAIELQNGTATIPLPLARDHDLVFIA
jgi:hypothetical protein